MKEKCTFIVHFTYDSSEFLGKMWLALSPHSREVLVSNLLGLRGFYEWNLELSPISMWVLSLLLLCFRVQR